MYIRLYRLLIILIISIIPLGLSGASHAGNASSARTELSISPKKSSQISNSISPKKLRKKLRRRPPIAEFFICLGAAAVLAVLAIVLANISLVSLILFIGAGVAFLASLLFLIQWAYYYW